jgi:hypothetical protein
VREPIESITAWPRGGGDLYDSERVKENAPHGLAGKSPDRRKRGVDG